MTYEELSLTYLCIPCSAKSCCAINAKTFLIVAQSSKQCRLHQMHSYKYMPKTSNKAFTYKQTTVIEPYITETVLTSCIQYNPVLNKLQARCWVKKQTDAKPNIKNPMIAKGCISHTIYRFLCPPPVQSNGYQSRWAFGY